MIAVNQDVEEQRIQELNRQLLPGEPIDADLSATRRVDANLIRSVGTHPVAAIAAAVGVGLLLGFVVKRKLLHPLTKHESTQ